MSAGITTQTSHLHELSALQWHAMLKFRAQIFVVEQHCFYLDPDKHDPISIHLCAYENAEVVGYLRIIPPLHKGEEAMLGRIAVAATHRAKGLGRRLMAQAIDYCHLHYAGVDIALSAQAHLQRYYESFGFEAEGEPYDDAGVPHIFMRKAVENV